MRVSIPWQSTMIRAFLFLGLPWDKAGPNCRPSEVSTWEANNPFGWRCSGKQPLGWKSTFRGLCVCTTLKEVWSCKRTLY